MTLTLHLPPQLEERLKEVSAKKGLTDEAMTLQILDQHLPKKSRQEKLLILLNSFLEEKDDDQAETWEFLVKALD